MKSMAQKGYTTATDFADYLVQNKKLSFREAYKISAKLVNYAEKKRKKLNELSFSEVKNCLLYTSPSPRDGLLSRMPSSA